MEPYLAALHREIAEFQPGAPQTVDTIFFGGGTPSRLSGTQIFDLIQAVRDRFDLLPGAEITLESNPEDLTDEAISRIGKAGVGRLTVGVQSLDPDVLRQAGRGHDGEQAVLAVAAARKANIGQVAVDLIAGLPGEAPDRWGATLRRLAVLEPDHFSVYLLETDKDTPLTRSMRSGRTARPDDDELADAWETTTDYLESAGYRQYEISNYARSIPGEPDHVSRHNLKYWQDLPYAGFGLGAHAYHQGERRGNRRDLDGYISDLAAGRDPVEERDRWHPVRRLEEALFMGLRLREGVDARQVGSRYGLDLLEAYRLVWERAEDQGLLVRDGSRIRLTRSGRLQSNSVFAAVLGHLSIE
jgi:oxygen-independent coproporphyrinogen-3 oxidase